MSTRYDMEYRQMDILEEITTLLEKIITILDVALVETKTEPIRPDIVSEIVKMLDNQIRWCHENYLVYPEHFTYNGTDETRRKYREGFINGLTMAKDMIINATETKGG